VPGGQERTGRPTEKRHGGSNGATMGGATPAASEQRAAASIDRSELEREKGTDGGRREGLLWREAEYPKDEPGGAEQNRGVP